MTLHYTERSGKDREREYGLFKVGVSFGWSGDTVGVLAVRSRLLSINRRPKGGVKNPGH